jgi:DNA (cytosine-5)-methyltransferase 1
LYNRGFKVRQATKKGYDIAYLGDSINLEQPNSTTRRGRVGKQISNTLTTSCNMAVVVKEDNMEYRIRKLTPKECWRLMGFKDEQFLKAEQVCSNSQLYKQAGNSIVVNVMEEIFKNLI